MIVLPFADDICNRAIMILFNLLLRGTPREGASVVAPRAVSFFHMFLSVLSPVITVPSIIDWYLCISLFKAVVLSVMALDQAKVHSCVELGSPFLLQMDHRQIRTLAQILPLEMVHPALSFQGGGSARSSCCLDEAPALMQ